MWWTAALDLLKGKKSEYKPYEYNADNFRPTKANVAEKASGGSRDFSGSSDFGLSPFSNPAYSKAFENAAGGGVDTTAGATKDDKKKEGYGDTADWVAAAASLLSNLEAERQAKQMALMAQRNASANYGLNAMGAAGSALGGLGQGRMSGLGLSSMAGA